MVSCKIETMVNRVRCREVGRGEGYIVQCVNPFPGPELSISIETRGISVQQSVINANCGHI